MLNQVVLFDEQIQTARLERSSYLKPFFSDYEMGSNLCFFKIVFEMKCLFKSYSAHSGFMVNIF